MQRAWLRRLAGFNIAWIEEALLKTASGAVLYAYQNDDIRKRWAAMWEPQPSSQAVADRRNRWTDRGWRTSNLSTTASQ